MSDPNRIRDENELPGTTAWQLDGPVSDDDGVPKKDRAGGQIQGYASLTSVNQGETIHLHVTVSPPQPYWIEVYRMGWYGGDGGRLVQRVGPLSGTPQRIEEHLPRDAHASVYCQWAVGHSIDVPTDWSTGIYLAKLINSHGYQSYVMFVVRDDEPETADLLYVQAVNTYQAYNKYPGKGASFYSGTPPGREGPWDRALSFDRPYGSEIFLRNIQSPFGAPGGDGSAGFFSWDYPMLRWLEREEYRVAYATNIDLHDPPVDLTQYRAILFVGHDEYWSNTMATVASNARDAGVSLAFLTGNMVFGTVGYGNAPEPLAPPDVGTGRGDRLRVMKCHSKGGAPNEPSDDFEKRQLLTGLAVTGCCVRAPLIYYNLPWVVSDKDHWIFEGTGFENGHEVPGLLGYETDAWRDGYSTPDHLSFEIVARSPFDESVKVSTWDIPEAHTVIYQAPSGAWVFTAGTTDWPTGLDVPFGGDVSYDAAAGDPTMQGWYESKPGSGRLLNDRGGPAWRTDCAAWSHRLNATRAQAAVDHYVLTVVLRVESGGEIRNYYDSGWGKHGGERFMPTLRLVGTGNDRTLVADFEDGDSCVLASGEAATDYHTHVIKFDGAEKATYEVDDAAVKQLDGVKSKELQVQLTFGCTGTSGVAYYRSVHFGLPQPCVPHLGIQTTTANVLNRMISQGVSP